MNSFSNIVNALTVSLGLMISPTSFAQQVSKKVGKNASKIVLSNNMDESFIVDLSTEIWYSKNYPDHVQKLKQLEAALYSLLMAEKHQNDQIWLFLARNEFEQKKKEVVSSRDRHGITYWAWWGKQQQARQ